MKKGWIIALAILGFLILAVVIIIGYFVSSYNSIVAGEQSVKEQWAQVENVYQRRLDLIPNLVETVKGYAKHEKETFVSVTEARSKVSQINMSPDMLKNADQFSKFNDAQAGLSSALSRLMVVVEKYPELKANENFKGLQVELAGSENRISNERRRYNEIAKAYNTNIKTVPQNFIAGMFNFKEYNYFKADEGAAKAPKVNFN